MRAENPDGADRAKALMVAHSPHVRHAMAEPGRDPSTHGAVILASDVTAADRTAAVFEVVPELRVLRGGGGFVVATLEAMRELASRLRDARAAALLSEPVTPGHVWVLVVLPRVVAVAPLGRPEAPASPTTADDTADHEPPTDTGLGAFLRRWPETAHLAARLDPAPDARGRTTFDLGLVVEVFEEFLRITESKPVAPPDMRAEASRVRRTLPALRARAELAARSRPKPN